MKEKLTAFEKDILQKITASDSPDFKSHINSILVDNREYTGHGMYINFKDRLSSANENLSLGKNFYIDIDGLKHGSGVILYIDKGKITTLELFSHGGEVFPEEIKSYKISKREIPN